jgi:hypothetical protein
MTDRTLTPRVAPDPRLIDQLVHVARSIPSREQELLARVAELEAECARLRDEVLRLSGGVEGLP